MNLDKIPRNFHDKVFDMVFCCNPTSRAGGLCFIGDSNNLVDVSKKRGGCQNTTTYMNNFINFLNKRNLISLNMMRVPYTLIIYEKLDQGIVNIYWLTKYSDYNLHNYPIYGSNHGHILLTYDMINEIKITPFKFGAVWLLLPEFKDFVKNAWRCNGEFAPIDKFRTCAAKASPTSKF
ncbi:hypothetical protein DVH24_030217 [Malus domestica]|uniref:Uncharacterized protein n=1 Tax=Malus domestica TaxID=3750 RepID=A0A498HVM5_MALDO|nr:hypothetical protein DVH24_030217 [Malus domestica]